MKSGAPEGRTFVNPGCDILYCSFWPVFYLCQPHCDFVFISWLFVGWVTSSRTHFMHIRENSSTIHKCYKEMWEEWHNWKNLECLLRTNNLVLVEVTMSLLLPTIVHGQAFRKITSMFYTVPSSWTVSVSAPIQLSPLFIKMIIRIKN